MFGGRSSSTENDKIKSNRQDAKVACYREGAKWAEMKFIFSPFYGKKRCDDVWGMAIILRLWRPLRALFCVNNLEASFPYKRLFFCRPDNYIKIWGFLFIYFLLRFMALFVTTRQWSNEGPITFLTCSVPLIVCCQIKIQLCNA